MAAALASIHCLYSAKAVPMNGAPSSNADKAAFRRSAGKCAASMVQKIALRAENKPCPSNKKRLGPQVFPHAVRFFAGIGPAHFLD